MSARNIEITVADVSLGMYVCELDRPWLETPFLMQGFLVESEEDINALAAYCKVVFVDPARSREDVRWPKRKAEQSAVTEFPQRPNRPAAADDSRRKKVVDLLGGRPVLAYRDRIYWRTEMSEAKRALLALNREIRKLFDSLVAGRGYKIAQLKQAVGPLVRSIERNPDACMWLARLKHEDGYIYRHSVGTAIWAVAFGRELGLPPNDLKSLALGALLLDVGKLQLPGRLFVKREALSAADEALLRSHVELSLAALRHSPMLNEEVHDMVAGHHERYDGSGYPRGLKGNDIPLFARIVGIADTYDAMTLERPYGQALSPSTAIRRLYERRDKQFDAILVEEFIQAVGVYPAGTPVLLSSNEVAVVVAEGRTRRLRPQVLLLTDRDQHPLKQLKVINLLNATDCEGNALEIVQGLEPGAVGVHSESIAALSAH